MTTTQTPTYAQVRDMVYALSFEDILRLKEDLENSWMKQGNQNPYCPPFGPANIEEAVCRLQESETQYRAGNFYSCKETETELEEEFPWLKE